MSPVSKLLTSVLLHTASAARISREGLLAAVLALAAAASFAGPVGYELRRFPGAPAHVVTVDLSCPAVSVTAQLAAGGPGKSEPFRSMLRRTRPSAAITGAFFDPRSKYPVGDIAVGGRLVHKGHVGNGICVSATGEVEFVPRSRGVATGWQGYDTVICGGPTLLANGRKVLSPRDEGFRDPALFTRHRRTAAGLTYNNKLLLVSINRPIYLGHLASIMKALGCRDAITLDGGSSAGLWYSGRILSTPSRRLTNLVAVHVSPAAPKTSAKVARVPLPPG